MILFTGRGKSGSWKIRGEQLGGQVGKVLPMAPPRVLSKADVIVLVKRPTASLLADIQRSGRPWVWDIVDAYPQPECTRWDLKTATGWVQQKLREYQPTGVIWPNQRMAIDCGGGSNDIVIYHHFNPGLRANPVRDRINVIGYEGSPRYIQQWGKHIRKECARRGWRFDTAGTMSDWDAVIAVRDRAHNGYPQWAWKSNVKLANAHGTGTPFIGATECGYTETAAGREIWCDRPEALPGAFDTLAQADREQIHSEFMRWAYPLQDAARDLKRYLDRV